MIRKIAFGLVFLVLFMGCVSTPNSDTNQVDQNQSSVVIPPTDSAPITSTQLSTHKTEQDCWVAFEGKAYDLTNWLPKHPGSAAAIAPYCGTSEEFENAFTGKHGTSKVNKMMEESTLKGDFSP